MFRIYYISDSSLTPSEPPAQSLVEAIRAGVEMVQIREKARSAREVLGMTREVVAAARPEGAEVYVNGRFDIAAPAGMRIGRSTHSTEEAVAAEGEGADFIVFGPVFETPSKARYGPPVGLVALEETLARVRIPVYAIGGMKPENVGPVLGLPVSGVAVISAIAGAADRGAVVTRFRDAARRARGEDS